jgi:uncharacterized circularly permuted ATP-grasp superfamily protein
VKALNMFIHDIYHEQNIIKAGIIPAEQIYKNAQYRPEMQGINGSDIYAHIAGVDIVRAGQGEFYVLEDNLRVPSGVSYMLEDRKMMMRLFPELFARNKIAPVDHYPDMLLDNLRSVAPMGVNDPTVVVMTPGMYNSAYFEHAFLAQQMGVELVEGKDLFVSDNTVYMRTTRGPKRVDVIYRRLDDDFLDPLAFRPIPRSACRACCRSTAPAASRWPTPSAPAWPTTSRSTLCAGHDQVLPVEEPILNNVPTYQCRKPEDLAYTLANLPSWWSRKCTAPAATACWSGRPRPRRRSRLPPAPARQAGRLHRPADAGPVRLPDLCGKRHRAAPHRPAAVRAVRQDHLHGAGGLTRVALQEGSLVVNSSQGGGTKDTWILEK